MLIKFDKNPHIAANIHYYDTEYSAKLAERVLDVLIKHGLFHPVSLSCGTLKKSRHITDPAEMRTEIVTAYAKKDVLAIVWEAVDSCDVIWGLTHHKLSRQSIPAKDRIIPVAEQPNLLKLQMSYEWLTAKDHAASFLAAVKELIQILDPLYVSVDDAENRRKILGKHSVFRPTSISPICWGNFCGKDLCQKLALSRISEPPFYHVEHINGGIYYELSEHPLLFNNDTCKTNRRLLVNLLHKVK